MRFVRCVSARLAHEPAWPGLPRVPGARVAGAAAAGGKIGVDRGSGVTFVHYDTQKSPASPNPPRKKAAATALASEYVCRRA